MDSLEVEKLELLDVWYPSRSLGTRLIGVILPGSVWERSCRAVHSARSQAPAWECSM